MIGMIRAAILAIPCLVLAFQTGVYASTVTTTLVDSGKTLEIADQGVRGLIEHMKALRQSKEAEFDRGAALRIKNRLAPYLAPPGEPSGKQELLARHPVDRFLRAPSLDNWSASKREVQAVLMSVMYLLQDVKKTRSDFVGDHVLQELARFFDGDDSVQSQLALMVPPSTEAEMRAAKAVREKYWTLRRDLTKAQVVLADYVQHLPKPSAP